MGHIVIAAVREIATTLDAIDWTVYATHVNRDGMNRPVSAFVKDTATTATAT